MFPSMTDANPQRAKLRSRTRRLVVLAVSTAAVVATLVPPAAAQVTVQSIIGRAVTDDTHTADVTSAINRFSQRDFDGARLVFERIHSEDPKVPPPGVMMATMWLATNQAAAARRDLEMTVKNFPEDPEAYLVFGDLDFQERRVTEAQLLFERAAELTSRFEGNAKRKRDFEIRASAGMAAVHEAREKWGDALGLVERWIELDPDSASARQRLGNILFYLDRPEDALNAFREARKLDAEIRQPELLLATLYDQRKQVDKARALVESAVEGAGDDAVVRVSAANWFLMQGDIAAARENAEAAIAADPKSLDAKLVSGTIARVSRDFSLAAKFFEDAHSQSPRNFGASDSLALALAESAEKDDVQRALELAETNLAMVKDNPQMQLTAATTLGWVYYKLGRRDEAEKILSQVAQNNAVTADAAYYIARILADKGQQQQAFNVLEQVMANGQMFANRAAADELIESLRGGAATPEGK